MTRGELVAALRERDALTIAAAGGALGPVHIIRGHDPGDVFVDDGTAGLEDHRAAHRAGRRSVAALPYGEDVDAEATADRLLALDALARETGLLHAVRPTPAPGRATPGSWGVEDLTVIAACRRVLGDAVRVRPDWERIGAQTCGVALAFGADELVVPEGDRTDIEALAAAAGRVTA